MEFLLTPLLLLSLSEVSGEIYNTNNAANAIVKVDKWSTGLL